MAFGAITMGGWGGWLPKVARFPLAAKKSPQNEPNDTKHPRNHQKTGLVDDAVFELKVTPKNWSQIVFEPYADLPGLPLGRN
jgi:hypothetical protein